MPPFEETGFLIQDAVIDQATVAELLEQATLPAGRVGRRDLLATCPSVAALSRSRALLDWVELLIGGPAFPVRAILFDKSTDTNWTVAWHQDLAIPVEEPIEGIPGFRGWSRKEGVWHVHPPAEILAGMVTARIHLDRCHEDNGPLRVLPGSHRSGKLTAADVERIAREISPQLCLLEPGGILFMRPLLLHASEPARGSGHRRVIHIEYARDPLPDGLKWASAEGV